MEAPHVPARVRHSSSQYDFVKVRVWLGEGEDRHATVLSRFLLVRTLTAAKVPYDAAVKVALHVKKELVDGDQLDVSQAQLEATIFRVMRKRAFGDDFVSRYRMLSAFHLKRAPLVLLIVGGVCTGKTTVATKLSQRLNLPNVLQTDMVYQVLRSSRCAPGENSAAVSLRESGSTDVAALQQEYEAECAEVCKALDSMLRKCLSDGKALVIEGLHCHSGMYASRIRELSAEEPRQPPVVVPIALNVGIADRKMLMHERLSRPPSRDVPRAATSDELVARAAALDEAASNSGAYTGALLVSFKPSHMPDSLALMHEHVLSRVKECA